jgi:hypothetical protein
MSSSSQSQQSERSLRFAEALRLIQRPQARIAEILGISPGYVSHVKTGTRDLSEALASKMQRRFGFSMEWLLTGEGEMVADRSRAARYVDPDDLPNGTTDAMETMFRADLAPGDLSPPTFREAFVKRFMAATELASPHLLFAQRASEWRRCVLDDLMNSATVPLLDELTGQCPEESEHFSGARIELPCPRAECLYCVRAHERWAPEFSQSEFLVIEQRPPDGWSKNEVDGEVCVVSGSKEDGLQLTHVHAVEEGDGVKLTIAPVPAGPGRKRTVAWADVQIHGVLRLCFRTRFPVPQDG